DLDAGVGQRVHQRGLARVRVTHQRDGRVGNLEAAPALNRARAFDFAQPRFEAGEPLAQTAPVNLELRFSGSARTYAAASRAAAANARKMRPLPREARLQVAELRDLDLQ